MRGSDDETWMHRALALATDAAGRTWPNPNVGCVIVSGGACVGQAATADGGRPHAETRALALAGAHARGAVAYVTLEPCSHTGVTGPCADALINAGIARVVVASVDQDARVGGRGIERLRRAGVEVTVGVGAVESNALLAGFFRRVTVGLPRVHLTSGLGEPRDKGPTRAPDGPAFGAARADARVVSALWLATRDAIVTPTPPILVVLDDDRAHADRVIAQARTRRPGAVWWLGREDASPASPPGPIDAKEGQRVLSMSYPASRAPASAVLHRLGEVGLNDIVVSDEDPIARMLATIRATGEAGAA